MKQPKQNAERWLREAEYTFRLGEKLHTEKAYSYACFLAEQTAQKALKAVLYFDGARLITMHSIAKLLEEIGRKRPEFLLFKADGGRLDQYYLSTRYPDAVAEPAIPSEIFVEDQSREALDIARKIFDASKTLIG